MYDERSRQSAWKIRARKKENALSSRETAEKKATREDPQAPLGKEKILNKARVRIGHVNIEVREYKDGRWGFDDYSRGPRHKVRFRTKQKALDRATDTSVFLANGRNDLLSIDRAELAEFRRWKLAAKSSRTIKDVVDRFLQLKQSKSSRHVESITGDLRLFEKFIGEETLIGTVTAERIQEFLDAREVGQRRKFNLRAAIISLFRWARRMSYLDDRTTEAEKVEPIERKPGTPNIYTPDQMRIALENVRAKFLPWLATGGFGGVRSEEIAPEPESKKSPLDWSDFHWKLRVIRIRPETSKTGEEREVPILPNLAEWLAPYRKESGPICEGQPTKHETARLGKFIGGWKHNALRDSFCSYRSRITRNIHQTCYEMGTSIPMAKRSYHRSQPAAPARAWFKLRPETQGNVIAFPKKVPKSSKNSMSKEHKTASG